MSCTNLGESKTDLKYGKDNGYQLKVNSGLKFPSQLTVFVIESNPTSLLQHMRFPSVKLL